VLIAGSSIATDLQVTEFIASVGVAGPDRSGCCAVVTGEHVPQLETLDASERLEERRKDAAIAPLRDRQLHIDEPGHQRPRPATVAFGPRSSLRS
jgi:hypothetical protein